MSHGNNSAHSDILANRRYEDAVRREAAERKRRRDDFLRRRDEEYARAFPQNLKHGRYNARGL